MSEVASYLVPPFNFLTCLVVKKKKPNHSKPHIHNAFCFVCADAKGLSPASKKKVEIFQEQILQSLETRTKTMYPVSPQRFSKLLLRLAPLKAISLEVMQHMEVQRALGNAKMDNLFGELLDFE